MQDEDEEDDEQTIEEEEQLGSEDEENELDDLEAVKKRKIVKEIFDFQSCLGCEYAFGRIIEIIWPK